MANEITSIKIGNTTYNIDFSQHSHNYLPLSGGTITGNLTMMAANQHNTDQYIFFKYSNTDLDNYSWRIGYEGTGSGNDNRLIIQSNGSGAWTDVLTFGLTDHIAYFSKTPKVGTTNVSLEGHTHDGRYYTETEVNNLLAGKADTHSHNYISSTTTRTKNTVLAGPSSGSNAAPTFRALVAADIPNLSATKITSDKLDIARIPTGTTSTTVALGNHDHDGRYYTETEVNNLLAGKADTHSHPYIPLAGGTLEKNNSQIQRAGSSTSWYLGRSNAMIKINSYTGYNAIASMKTTDGDWSMGVYSGNNLYFSYVTDTDFNNNNNATTAQIVFKPTGYITANLTGNASTATALTSSAGSATNPIYFSEGKPVACTYSLNKTVPSDAKFTDTVYSHPTDGANTTKGPTANVTGTDGTTIKVPKITVDSLGHVTGLSEYTYTSKNTTYSNMTGATSSAAGTSGLVPAPAKGNQGLYLRGDGTWATPTNTTYSVMTGATSSAAGAKGLVPAPAAGKQTSFLRGDGTWVIPTNTTYSAGTGLSLSGTTFSANGSSIINALGEGTSPAQRDDYIVAQYAGGGTTTTTYHRRKLSNIFAALNKSDITTALGYTPPTTNTIYDDTALTTALTNHINDTSAHKDTTYSAGDNITISGTTISAKDTTYSNFVKSGSGAKAGLVPAPSTTSGTTKYLREDGTWVTPPGTYSHPTNGANTTKGPTADVTGTDGTTIKVPKITVNSLGHVTSLTEYTYTSKNSTYSPMTGATASAAGTAGLVPIPVPGKQTSFLRGDGTWATPPNTTYTAGTNITISGTTISATDTKNTAGATDTSSKIFLIGATSQAANPQTYSHDTVYVDTNGNLNSNSAIIGGSVSTWSSYISYGTSESTYSTLSTYTGSMGSISGAIGNGVISYYAFLFGNTASSTTIKYRVPINGTTQYVSYSVPAGKKISVTFKLQSYQYMKVNSTQINSCTFASIAGTFYAGISSVQTPTSTSSILSSSSLNIPCYTSNYTNHTSTCTVTYTNTGSAAKTVYAVVYATQSGIPVYDVKTSSGGSNLGSGTVYLYPQALITAASIKTPATEARLLNSGALYCSNGFFIGNGSGTSGNMIYSYPGVFIVKSNQRILRISGTTAQTSSNGGQSWSNI